ncbi:MAG: hypothetical protein ACYC9Y_06335 [Candidatus Methylomirabilia bacterium]
MKKMIGVIGAAVLVLALQAPAHGLDLRVGANVNYGTANDFGLGPRVELDFNDYVPGLRLAGDYHKFFASRVYNDIDELSVKSNSWDVGLHVVYDFTTVAIAEGATLYAGAGVLYAKRSYDYLQASTADLTAAELLNRAEKLKRLQEKYQGDSGASLALTVGSTFNTGWTVVPFVEARYTIGVVDELMVAAGLLFSTGLGAR